MAFDPFELRSNTRFVIFLHCSSLLSSKGSAFFAKKKSRSRYGLRFLIKCRINKLITIKNIVKSPNTIIPAVPKMAKPIVTVRIIPMRTINNIVNSIMLIPSFPLKGVLFSRKRKSPFSGPLLFFYCFCF